MLLWAWRLKVALEPFWSHDPDLGLRDFAFVGWSLEVQQLVSDIYKIFTDAYKSFINCYEYLEWDGKGDHPLLTTWFRPIAQTDMMRDSARLLATSEAPWDSGSYGRSAKCFTGHELAPWGVPHEGRIECLTGKIADDMCSPFEDRNTADELNWKGYFLETQVWRELYPRLFITHKIEHDPSHSDGNLEPSERRTNQPQLSRDGLACAAWHDLVTEGKTPTKAEVARRVGCHRSCLERCPHFMNLVKAYQRDAEDRKRRMPRGWRDGKTGSMEALVDADEEGD
jgi:hypothetical protein